MNFLDTLRRLLGFGDRRLRPKLGLPEGRRSGENRRRSPEETEREALDELERLAWIKWKGERKAEDR